MGGFTCPIREDISTHARMAQKVTSPSSIDTSSGQMVTLSITITGGHSTLSHTLSITHSSASHHMMGQRTTARDTSASAPILSTLRRCM